MRRAVPPSSPAGSPRAIAGAGAVGSAQQQQQHALLVLQRRDNAEMHAVRNGVSQMWLDQVMKMFADFVKQREMIQAFVDRRAAEDARRGAQERRRAEARWGVLEAAKGGLRVDERAARSKVIIFEEKHRVTIERLQQRDYSTVEVLENLRKLTRNEGNKRYLLERAEERGFTAVVAAYGEVDWKPTLKVLGPCPFRSKAACPFRRGQCHGLYLADSHLAHLQPKQPGAQVAALLPLLDDSSPRIGGAGVRSSGGDGGGPPLAPRAPQASQPADDGAHAARSAIQGLVSFHRASHCSQSPRKRRLRVLTDPMEKLMATREDEEEAALLAAVGDAAAVPELLVVHPFNVSVSELDVTQLRNVP